MDVDSLRRARVPLVLILIMVGALIGSYDYEPSARALPVLVAFGPRLVCCCWSFSCSWALRSGAASKLFFRARPMRRSLSLCRCRVH
ncbi:MAG: hypothetical protein CM1200mP36_04350 [Gammaproteobacteria bacterium]|nr:MAG: hypothetical protein CM1200mP36_04350 [Gammaproteobacteria bacterium]